MPNTASAGHSATVTELQRHSAALICALVLVIASLVALFVPGAGVATGTLLGGGTQVSITVDETDESIDSIVALLQKRADSLYEHDVHVTKGGDNTVLVNVARLYDAQTVTQSLIGTGHIELVSQLDISDADELSLLSTSSDSVELAEGTYSAFITNDQITGANVAISGSGSSASYVVQISLNDEGQELFATETEELASSYGIIAVVLDGDVVATPYVYQKIESDAISISGGFTRDEAYAFAAKLNSGEINATLTVGESEELGDMFGGTARVVVPVVLVICALVIGFVLTKLYGNAGWLACASLLATTALGLGVMCVLFSFALVVLGSWELGAGVVVAILSVGASVAAAYVYNKERKAGASVRKSQQLADASMMFIERIYVVVCVVALVATFFVSAGPNEFAWALAAGLLAEFIMTWLVKRPLLCILTVRDTEQAQLYSTEGAAPETKE